MDPAFKSKAQSQKLMELDKDAFSSGQIQSKLWLAAELEKLITQPNTNIWNLAGWYGVLPFLLLSRSNVSIQSIRSFDIDPHSTESANLLNELWVWQKWKFRAFTKDVNQIDYSSPEEFSSPSPDWVINTSCEHMSSFEWWRKIPTGQKLALQASNMKHLDHVCDYQSLKDFVQCFPMTRVDFKGELEFRYPESSFKRFMIIGEK